MCKEELDELYNLLKKQYKDKFVGMILFGSYARHEEREHSDIDVMVIMKRLRMKLMDEIINFCMFISLNYGSLITPYIIEEKELFDNLYLCEGEKRFKIWKNQ